MKWRVTFLLTGSLLTLVFASWLLAARTSRADGGQGTDARTREEELPGRPRGDLTADEIAAFERGKELFSRKLPGVGPLFNDEACADCHAHPTVGGSGDLEHVAFMAPAKGKDVDVFRRHALPGSTVPERPSNVSRRVAPPLYGVGLIERIPDETIRAACGKGHPDSAKLQGSSPHNTIARFGAKPFLGTVADFTASAMFSESSVTTALEGAKDDDGYPDPEVDGRFVESVAAFVRGLEPPPRAGTDPAGERAFHAFGCATCHVPDMPPAANVFSDFCLHRMGDALADGIFDHEARGDEFRTTPLWGIRFKTTYLHDGRATTLQDAVRAHGGEASDAVRAYDKAGEEDRTALIRFLGML